jgi:RNA polymerase sigma factor (sigma-70 family)
VWPLSDLPASSTALRLANLPHHASSHAPLGRICRYASRTDGLNAIHGKTRERFDSVRRLIMVDEVEVGAGASMTTEDVMRISIGQVGKGAAADDLARSAALSALLDGNLEASYRLAAVLLGSRAEGEDATQDAVERAWRQWKSLRDPGRMRAWFTAILINTCRDRMRSRRRIRVPFDQDLVVDGDPGGHLARRDLLERAFEHLDPDHRIVLTLRYYLDLPVSEIAVRTGIPEGTVKSRLHHAERRLRLILDAEEARS